jgi:hypothetical protein
MRTKKRKVAHHEDTIQKIVHIWNGAHLNEDEFVEEAIDALGTFANAQKWPVSRLSAQLRK